MLWLKNILNFVILLETTFYEMRYEQKPSIKGCTEGINFMELINYSSKITNFIKIKSFVKVIYRRKHLYFFTLHLVLPSFAYTKFQIIIKFNNRMVDNIKIIEDGVKNILSSYKIEVTHTAVRTFPVNGNDTSIFFTLFFLSKC